MLQALINIQPTHRKATGNRKKKGEKEKRKRKGNNSNAFTSKSYNVSEKRQIQS